MTERFARIPVSAAKGGLGQRALRVYIAISGRACRRTYVSFPGLRQIAKDTGIDLRALDREIAKLQKEGFLRVERRHPHANRYTILFPDEVSRQETTPEAHETVQGVVSRHDTESRQETTPESSLETTKQTPYRKPSRRAHERGGAPERRRRSSAASPAWPPSEEDRALLVAALQEEAYRKHGIWPADWGTPPPLEPAAAA